MKYCVIYYYESNKNFEKEDYESAYISSYLKRWGECDLFLRLKDKSLILDDKYDKYFIKLYNSDQFPEFKEDFRKNNIALERIVFYGQFCRNNIDIITEHFDSAYGIIVDDVFDTINGIMNDNKEKDGLVYINNHRMVRGKIPDKININDIPKADRTIMKMLGQKFAEVCFSRGCNKRCSFCTLDVNKIFDCKDNIHIIEELNYIIGTTDARRFVFKDMSFEDRIFKNGIENFEVLIDEIKSLRPSVAYDLNFRIGSFTSRNLSHQDLFKKLRESGLTRVFYGVESFIEEERKLFNKSFTNLDIKESIKLCRDNFIYPVCSFIFLNPYSTLDSIKYNLEMAKQLDLLDFLPAALNILRLEKGSLLYKRLANENMILVDENKECYSFKDNSVEVIAKIFKALYQDIQFWRSFILIPEIHELKNEVAYKNTKLESTDFLIDEVANLLEELNKQNHEFLLSIISNLESGKVDHIERIIWEYKNSVLEQCIIRCKEFYKRLRKEIEVLNIIERRMMNLH